MGNLWYQDDDSNNRNNNKKKNKIKNTHKKENYWEVCQALINLTILITWKTYYMKDAFILLTDDQMDLMRLNKLPRTTT